MQKTDYSVTHHVFIVFDIILYFICCSVIVFCVYLFALIK